MHSSPIFLALLGALLPTPAAIADWNLPHMTPGQGSQRIFQDEPVDESLLNPWPAELEAEFQARARRIIAGLAEQRGGVNTYFENEKRTYGVLMAHILSGDVAKRAAALEHLQAQDHQHEEWHRETAGIDYYAAFTLKHQVRKYFYFGDLLEPAYRKQMFDGAERWTEIDPLGRPHYAYRGPKEGWGPDARNSWVDVRSTENLYLMRETSVYLMAEETGNLGTAAIYKKHLLDYTSTLFRIGIGEWDSENYLGHAIAPLLNLYDFAKDTDIKRAAKACLDFYAAAGAVKYFRGGFNGPTKRDYNHAQPFGGSAPNMLWVWFGDHPSGKTGQWESDEVHMLTSAYRPPLAVVLLARKNFARPVELTAAKPTYSATTSYQPESPAEFLETQFLANSYQMGSLTSGTSEDGGDVNGFKILAFDREVGAIALHAVPGPNPALPGSPMYKSGVVSGPNRIAQMANLALWLVKDGTSPWLWVVPDDVAVSTREGVTFLACDRTWIAIRPLGATVLLRDQELSNQLQSGGDARFPGHQVLSCRGTSEHFSGLAVEAGEEESHGSLANFQSAVLSAEVDLSELQAGVARYKAADGKWLGIHWNDDPLDLGVWRNGARRDLQDAAEHLYRSAVIQSERGSGVLEVNAGGESFRCAVDRSGKVFFGR